MSNRSSISHDHTADQSHEYLGCNDFFGQGSSYRLLYRQESPARELCNFSKWRPCNHGTSTTRVIIRAPSRSKRGAARCIDWTFTLNVNSNAMRSTCASHLKKNGDSHRLNMSKFALHEHFFGRLFAYSVTSSCLLDRVR